VYSDQTFFVEIKETLQYSAFCVPLMLTTCVIINESHFVAKL
jgi:hypothetical protein